MSTRAVPFGKYHLLERVNVGGMAEVYKAKMVGVEGFEKLLAIKRILPAIAADKDFITMFIDEAKISVQLNHANIAQTFELGRINDTYFIALEFVPGRDLRAVFERLRRRGEVVPHELACYVMSRVAEGLDYAHRKKTPDGRELGIIHRDISPQNVLVSYEGEVKIIDFGIAKAAGKMMKTQAGILKGKFGYMSPEQVRGLALDRRSDIFAAGIVLYELLTGERLFTGESDYSVLEKVRAADVPRPSTVRKGVPQPLEKIVARALAKDPDDRYQHASELVADLQRYLLAQERLFTREDLAAFMKGTFAEEFEREKKSMLESIITVDEGTPTGTPTQQETHSNLQSAPELRPLASGRERPRLEGAAARPSTPPPPPSDAFLAEERRPSPLRPGRLAQAAQSAETDKVDVKIKRIDDEEDTNTDTDPAKSAAVRAYVDEMELTPTPEDRPLREIREKAMEEMPTRIGRAAPPPVPSQPPARPLSAPPRATRMPAAITDNLPEPVRRTPPPVAIDDDEEPTQLEKPARASARTPVGSRPLERPKVKLAFRVDEDEDDGESTQVGSNASVYTPRRRSQWAIVPIAGGIALVVGFLTLRAVQHRWPFHPARDPDDDIAAAAVAPLVQAQDFGSLKVVTDPTDAQLYLDQRLVKPGGDKPFVSDHIEADTPHVLVAKKDGFREASASVVVTTSGTKEISLKLRAMNPVLSVTTTPSGATVLVDEAEVGKTPEEIATLHAGSHTVRVELHCYTTVERKVTIEGRDVSLDLNLKPEPGACTTMPKAPGVGDPGTLKLVSKPSGRLFVDGNDTGRSTPLLEYPLPAGKHHLKLMSDDGRSEELDVQVASGQTVTRTVVLR